MSTIGIGAKAFRAAAGGIACIIVPLLLAGCSYEGVRAQPEQAAGQANEQAAPPGQPQQPPQPAANGEFVAGHDGHLDHVPPPATGFPTEDEVPAVGAVAPGAAATPIPSVQSAPTGQAMPIELSLGVALAQTLPEGTAMGFSVEYRFVQGGPQPSWQYLLLYQAGDGRRVGQPVALASQGTIQQFVQWRPGDGPFRAQMLGRSPDGTIQAVSAPIELRE